jgi:hypothetical protein
MVLLGVTLVALALLGGLTVLALRAGRSLTHPVAWLAALVGLFVAGALLLVE